MKEAEYERLKCQKISVNTYVEDRFSGVFFQGSYALDGL